MHIKKIQGLKLCCCTRHWNHMFRNCCEIGPNFSWFE